MNNKIICVCKCDGEEEKAATAFSLLFPGEEIPPILVGRKNTLFIIDAFPGSEIADFARAISDYKDKFEFYIEYDDEGNILEKINLITGRQI